MKIPARPSRKVRSQQGGGKPSIESRLLAATERLLEQGNTFAMISVNQLTTEAGLSRGTFYLHFKDKAELVARLMDFFVEEMGQHLGTWVANAAEAERADVSVAVKNMVRDFKKHQSIMVAVRDTMAQDPALYATYTQMVDKVADMAKKSIATIKSRGKSRPGASDEVGDALTRMMALYCTHLLDQKNPAQIKKAITALCYICESVIFSDDN